MKAVIIGSGMSGLIAGAKLAQAGYQVTVLEQFERTGGVTAPLEKDGFKWDLGQLLLEGLGPDEPTGQVFADLGIADQIKIVKDDRGYIFPNFPITKPENYSGPKWRIAYLQQKFPQDAAGLKKYWRDYLRFTRLMTFGRALGSAKGFQKFITQLKLYLTLLPLLPKAKWSSQQLMDYYFESDALKSVFISILADFFTKPSQFIGLGVFALNFETFYDQRIPKSLAKNTDQLYLYSVLGGISTVIDALAEKIKSHGGEVLVNRPVAKINIENHQVTGVVDEKGQTYPADVVVASGGAKEIFNQVVGQENLTPDFAQLVDDIALMDSVFMVHLGVDFDPSEFVHGVCTYYYGTYDIEGGVEKAKSGLYHEGEDGFVVHIPSLHSPEMAPAGQHAITVYTICPDTLSTGTWHELKEEYADKLIAYTEKHIPGLSQHIKTCEILTPEDFRKRTHLNHHAFGGIAPIMGKKGIPHQTPVAGLWFVGQQSESGGGLNNVIPAAHRVAETILQR